ncbi:hypothetical protein N7462_003192 [Penicillium macrosclerotiorum]|uniref:uncharacterized protein n=1 Tax=Penicillium macrosclerotiorum TaxID=303699 RepID=UPI002546AA95|nr:uncharacterized protein N7462_003192 [Penicillium macrosclerotiorum]KAJ5688800.1 hypothetical protein N7462_003192 [Penicillium macrosclerotiorum]
MSASPGSAAKPEKTMSSRLLTMKFMQRAAATAAAKEAQTPVSEDGQRTTKRPRLSTEAASSSTQSDLEAISKALAAEEEKRREATARAAAEAGESEWVLNIPVTTNYAPQPLVVAADSLDAEDSVLQGGRRAYGNFTRKKKTQDEDSDDSDDEDFDDINPANPEQVEAMIKRAGEKARAKELRKQEKLRAMAKSEKVKLSELKSISGSRKGSGPAPKNGGGSKKKKKRKN